MGDARLAGTTFDQDVGDLSEPVHGMHGVGSDDMRLDLRGDRHNHLVPAQHAHHRRHLGHGPHRAVKAQFADVAIPLGGFDGDLLGCCQHPTAMATSRPAPDLRSPDGARLTITRFGRPHQAAAEHGSAHGRATPGRPRQADRRSGSPVIRCRRAPQR